MTDRPARILALDVADATVRGIVLSSGPEAVAGGYAQLGYAAETGPASVAARIAAALDVKAEIGVVVTCDDSLGATVAEDVRAAVLAGGFSDVSVVPREDSMRRANPGGGPTEKLVDAQIAAGLLTSHAGLTLADLAPVVGAGLGALGLGAPVIGDEEPLEVWHPETPPVSAVPDDPFTADPSASSTPSVAAAAAIAGAAVVASSQVFDDDPTVIREAEASVDADNSLGDGKDMVPPVEEAVAAVAPDLADTQPKPVGAAVDAFADGDATVPPTPAPAAVTRSQATAATATSALAVPAGAASQAVASVVITAESDESRSKMPWVLAALALLTIAAVAAFFLPAGSSDEVAGETQLAEVAPTAAADAPADVPTPEPVVEPTAVPAVASTAAPAPEPANEPTAEPAPEPTVDPLEGLPPLASLPARGAIFRPPILFLEGPVQTQEQADELYARAIAVVGPDNVVNDYVVRPDAPAALDGNVRVEQAVLFQTGSAAIAEDFIPTLELGVAVMNLNPQVTMVVEGHTDSVGSESGNQQLSERRAEAVVEYLIGRGVDESRLQSVGLGESTPVEPNDTAEGRQLNRRIEVNLLDLLSAES